MQELLRIGCASGFAGDRADAGLPIVAELAGSNGFLVFETLAERTLALCQLEKRRDAARGYSPALERMLPIVLGPALANGIRIVGNFGGANPRRAGFRILALAPEVGFPKAPLADMVGDELTDSF